MIPTTLCWQQSTRILKSIQMISCEHMTERYCKLYAVEIHLMLQENASFVFYTAYSFIIHDQVFQMRKIFFYPVWTGFFVTLLLQQCCIHLHLSQAGKSMKWIAGKTKRCTARATCIQRDASSIIVKSIIATPTMYKIRLLSDICTIFI